MHVITIDSIIIIIVTTSSPTAVDSLPSCEPCTKPPTNKFNRFHCLAWQSGPSVSDGVADTREDDRDAQNAMGNFGEYIQGNLIDASQRKASYMHNNYVHDIYFSQICDFRPMTQPKPLKIKILDPLLTQPNPWVNPTHGQFWSVCRKKN